MDKELIKEVPFGQKAIARITVRKVEEPIFWDGIKTGDFNIILLSKVEVTVNGKVMEEANSAEKIEYSKLTDTLFEKGKLDPKQSYSRVDKAITPGLEAAININTAIEEMKKELSIEAQVQTEEMKNEQDAIEEAQAIIAQAYVEGIDKLMSAKEIKVWREEYNDLQNEGGEGYVPTKISREQYEKALNLLIAKDLIKTVVLYQWENLQAVSGWDVRKGFSFEYCGSYGFVDCTQGEEYILPVGYVLAESVAGEELIYDEKGAYCLIQINKGKPVLSSPSRNIIIHPLPPTTLGSDLDNGSCLITNGRE